MLGCAVLPSPGARRGKAGTGFSHLWFTRSLVADDLALTETLVVRCPPRYFLDRMAGESTQVAREPDLHDQAPADAADRARQRRPWQTPKVTVADVAATENGGPPPNDGPQPYS